MAQHLLLALSLLSPAQAAPTWPDGAVLLVDTTQLLYDEPATTEAELLAREGMVGIDPRWPQAQGAAGYLVLVAGKQVAELPSSARTWSGKARVGQQVAVLAVDAAGEAAPVLKARVQGFPGLSADGGFGAGGLFGADGASTSDEAFVIGSASSWGDATDGETAGGIGGRPGALMTRPGGGPPKGEREPLPAVRTDALEASPAQEAAGLRRRLTVLHKQLAFCLAKDGEAGSGSLVVGFEVRGDGTVTRVQAEAPGVPTGAVECVEAHIARLRLAAEHAGAVRWTLVW
ncbi:MAG: hypothetical protein H6742_08465 [Alphaproteobacteria bacterium]|nr:hypothetical protein [Alphaproteobacteria bacterium]